MLPCFHSGWNDASKGLFYASSLSSAAQALDKIGYRCGFTCERASRGLEKLPSLVHQSHNGANRYYWIVAVERGKPVFNVTSGEPPANQAGYADLQALMRLKGDFL